MPIRNHHIIVLACYIYTFNVVNLIYVSGIRKCVFCKIILHISSIDFSPAQVLYRYCYYMTNILQIIHQNMWDVHHSLSGRSIVLYFASSLSLKAHPLYTHFIDALRVNFPMSVIHTSYDAPICQFLLVHGRLTYVRWVSASWPHLVAIFWCKRKVLKRHG